MEVTDPPPVATTALTTARPVADQRRPTGRDGILPSYTTEDLTMASRPASARTPVLLTVDDVADQLQLSPKTVRRMIARNDLAAHRVGRQIRIAPSDLLALIHRGRMGVSM